MKNKQKRMLNKLLSELQKFNSRHKIPHSVQKQENKKKQEIELESEDICLLSDAKHFFFVDWLNHHKNHLNQSRLAGMRETRCLNQ